MAIYDYSGVSVKEIVDLRLKECLTWNKIAEEYGLPDGCYLYQFMKLNLNPDNPVYDPIGRGRVIGLLKGDMPFEDIAKEVGLSINGLKNYCSDYRLSDVRVPTAGRIAEMMQSGKNVPEIARYYGASRFHIRSIMRKNEEGQFVSGLSDDLRAKRADLIRAQIRAAEMSILNLRKELAALGYPEEETGTDSLEGPALGAEGDVKSRIKVLRKKK